MLHTNSISYTPYEIRQRWRRIRDDVEERWQDGAGTKYKLSDVMRQAFRKEDLLH
jgi:hypothetical protein